jgi:hypothetical protein
VDGTVDFNLLSRAISSALTLIGGEAILSIFILILKIVLGTTDLIGYTLNDDGEIVDEEGDAIGRVDLIPVEEQKTV